MRAVTSVARVEQLGRYTLLDRIAVGGMAELFRAVATAEVDPRFRRVVAVKRLLPHLAEESAHVAMFLDEARLAARLEHSGLVPAIDVGVHDGRPYWVMPLIEGVDLRRIAYECARTGLRMPPALVALIGRELLDALEYAHELRDERGRHLNVIHRDISPGNVLVSWRGDVRLVDFGIARAGGRASRTAAGQLKGKICYMAPEQLLGADVDARADIFSVGAVLAELLTGRRVFAAPSEIEVMRMVRDARIDRFLTASVGLPAALVVAITNALQRLPDDRWLFARTFRDALDRELQRLGTASRTDLAAFIARVHDAPTARAAAAAGEAIQGTPAAELRRLPVRAPRGTSGPMPAVGGDSVSPTAPTLIDDLALQPTPRPPRAAGPATSVSTVSTINVDTPAS
jgi:serine/threonine protein kinase